tara:strand:- start:236 stop:520 length:285 start_codon:yes stop_codon:yes gene_type:complete
MVRANPNISNYHYRVDIHDEDGKIIVSKHYYTLKSICEEFKVSHFTIYRIIKEPNYKPTLTNLVGVKIYKDYKPAILTTVSQNDEVYGELDDYC